MYFNIQNDALIDAIKSMSEKVEFPHSMYNPKNGDEVVVRNKDEHDKYADKGWVHEKPVNEVEEPQPEGEKEFKALHAVKVSGKNPDGTDIKEAVTIQAETPPKLRGEGADKIVKKLQGAGFVFGRLPSMTSREESRWIHPKTGMQVLLFDAPGRNINIAANDKNGRTIMQPMSYYGPWGPRDVDPIDQLLNRRNSKEYDIKESAITVDRNIPKLRGEGAARIIKKLQDSGFVFGKTSNLLASEEPRWIHKKTGIHVFLFDAPGRNINIAANDKNGRTIMQPMSYYGPWGPRDVDPIDQLLNRRNSKEYDIKEAAILATLVDIFESIDLDENAYKEFFKKALKKFGAESPADLDDEKKKEFFAYVDKNWKG